MKELDFNDLETDLQSDVKQAMPRETFPCGHCGGTGVWRSGYGHSGNCHACNGRGFFYTSPADRYAAKQKRAEAKQRKIERAQDSLRANHGELIDWLELNSDWNDFARSLTAQVKERGTLTDSQIAAAERMMAKTEATRAAKAKAKPKGVEVGSLARIIELFNAAKASGISRPKFRVAGLTLSPAPLSGRNAGFIYVKSGEEYLGKISPTGEAFLMKGAEEHLPTLTRIASDPLAEAKAYGQKTGNCSCCGRLLTNGLSVELGIGPICRDKWGM